MRRWLYKMQYKYSRFGIENLMLYITITMLAVFLSELLFKIPAVAYLHFNRALILRGQVWRLFTWVFLPPSNQLFLIILSLYVFYSIGNALESQWGKFSFSLYYLIGIIGTIIAGFIGGVATNSYLNTSLLLAFAQLFPDMQFLLFFLVPIKAKYIGYVSLIFYAISMIYALINLNFAEAIAIVASLLNFLIFFGPDMFDNFRQWLQNRKASKAWRNSNNRFR